MDWKAGGDTDLPLANRGREWDGDAAEKHIFDWAGWDEKQEPEKARQAFFAYDASAPENKTAYKLPFADVIHGQLKAVPRGIFAVAQVLQGARGGVDLPEDVLTGIRRKVTAYYRKIGEPAPWESDQD